MIYIYTGDMYAIKQRIKSFKLPVAYIDSIEEVYDGLFNHDLFDEYKCYVVFDDKFLTSKIIRTLENTKNIVVLILKDTRKNNSLYEKAETLKPLKTKEMVNIIKKEFDIKNAETLISRCMNDMEYALIEAHKIKNSDYDLFTQNMVGFVEYNWTNIYGEALLNKNYSKLFMLNQLEEVQALFLMIIYNIFSNAKRMLEVKSGGQAISEAQTNFLRNKPFTIEECIKLIRLTYEAQKQIKGGYMTEGEILDMLLLRFLE